MFALIQVPFAPSSYANEQPEAQVKLQECYALTEHPTLCEGRLPVIRDTIAHHSVTQVEAAEAMKISKAQLSDVIRQKKGVSANLALRVQFCFGFPGDLLIRLQGQFDFQKAFHAKNRDLQMEVRAIA